MARRTAVEEATKLIEQFFAETKAGYLQQVLATRQPGRRDELLNQLDVFDKVEGRAYDWLTSQAKTK